MGCDCPERTSDEVNYGIHACRDGKRIAPEDLYLTRPTADLGEDGELVERLGDEADLCRNEGASDIASLLDQARARLILYREALEGLVAAVEKDADENNGISGYTGARLSDARAVLSRSAP